MDPPWETFLTGDQITLTCDPASWLGSAKYVWNINDQGDKAGNKTYFIGTATKNDSGHYKCKVKSTPPTPDDPYSNTILVNVTDPDSELMIKVESDKLWVEESLQLRCTFAYIVVNKWIYRFYREGSMLTEIRTENNSIAFEMEHVYLEHGGRYRCEVMFVEFPNGRRYSSGYIAVRVAESPVSLDVKPKTPRVGDTVELRCVCTESRMSGSRTYSFYRNKTLVKSASGIPEVYRIQRATVMDSDWYHCAIRWDPDTYPSRRVEITVKRIPVSDVRLSLTPSHGTVREGRSLTLTCLVAEGSTPLTYAWYRGGSLFHQENASSRELAFKIDRCDESTEGSYSCGVSNEVEGKQIAIRSPEVDVVVQVPVSCPSLSSSLNGSAVAVGARVTFACRSQRGTRPITYQLHRDRHLLANTTVAGSGAGNFTVAVGSEDQGANYSCGAANGVGDVATCSGTITLTVSSADDLPVAASNSTVLVCVLAVTSAVVLALVILTVVCKTRRKLKENSGSPRAETVYAVVQTKRNADGRDNNGVRINPRHAGASDYYVTYAQLNFPQMENSRAPGQRDTAAGTSESAGIYQNFRTT
uniref:Fc receptor-like protein 2 n=1 Tax=Pristiophorus japonicus TaxID=55135 RepID=UPI00398E3492